MAANMMGFRKVSSIPKETRRGVYDDLIETVAEKDEIYMLDTQDVRRSKSLVATLKNRISKLKLPVIVKMRGTTVYVHRRKDD